MSKLGLNHLAHLSQEEYADRYMGFEPTEEEKVYLSNLNRK